MSSLDEPEAKSAMIWILGEYAERIDNVLAILEDFMEGFVYDSVQVRLTQGTSSFEHHNILTHLIGADTNTDRNCQIVPQETRSWPESSSTGVTSSHFRKSEPGSPRSSLHILEIAQY